MIWHRFRERLRTRAVDGLQATGVVAEPGLNRFTEQAAQAFAASASLLTLVRGDRLWVAAGTGFDLVCVPRGQSFCTQGIDKGEILEVGDARADPVFRVLPVVSGPPFVRYYIGAPLTLANGIDVGMLCVLDGAPRPPASVDQRAYLSGLARQATVALERHAQSKRRAAA